MREDELQKLSKQDLLSLVEICRRNWRATDGFWFMAVEERWGTEQAIEIDEMVWGELGKRAAYRLHKAFKLEKKIRGLVKALKFDPGYLYFEYSVEQSSENKAILQVTSCLAQKRRLEIGKGVFDCRGVEMAYLTNFARFFDPRIKVYCEFCPPERYFPDLWCEWHFHLQ